jgi:TonB family protein
MIVPVVLLMAAAQAGAPERSPIAGIITSSDYPPAAILLGQEGEVEARFTISAQGRAVDCTVLRSSGFSTLDAATCDLVKTRARFAPALDQGGRPIASTFTQKVRWMLKGNELPLAPWTLRFLVALDKTGTPTNCSGGSGGALSTRQQFTIECSELSGAFTVPPDLARRYAGRRVVIIFDQQFVPRVVDSINTPRDLRRYPLLSQQVMRLQIDGLGQVAGCRVTRSEGAYRPPDSCATMALRRFKPYRGGPEGALVGTTTMSTYAYVR